MAKDFTVLEDLECVEVSYNDTKKKVIITFLDEQNGEIREVNFNKQSWDNGKYVDDDKKAAQVEEWCQKYFGLTFDTMIDAVGQKKTIYAYPTFSSLWEASDSEFFRPTKFTKAMCGTIYQTEVKEIAVDDLFIKIRYDIEGNTYESKQSMCKWFEPKKMFLKDPVKKAKEYEKFKEKYGVPVEEKDTLIGHPLMVEVKSCFGNNYYGDIKKFPSK